MQRMEEGGTNGHERQENAFERETAGTGKRRGTGLKAGKIGLEQLRGM